MYEPILMSKMSFDKLNSKQQNALMEAGKVAEKYMTAQVENLDKKFEDAYKACLLYTSPSPRDRTRSRMPSSA